ERGQDGRSVGPVHGGLVRSRVVGGMAANIGRGRRRGRGWYFRESGRGRRGCAYPHPPSDPPARELPRREPTLGAMQRGRVARSARPPDRSPEPEPWHAAPEDDVPAATGAPRHPRTVLGLLAG